MRNMCNNIYTMSNDTIYVPSEKETYIKTYRMQATGAGGKTIRTSVPSEVVEKEARRLGLTVKEFVSHYRVMWLYNGFEGAWAKFVPKE